MLSGSATLTGTAAADDETSHWSRLFRCSCYLCRTLRDCQLVCLCSAWSRHVLDSPTASINLEPSCKGFRGFLCLIDCHRLIHETSSCLDSSNGLAKHATPWLCVDDDFATVLSMPPHARQMGDPEDSLKQTLEKVHPRSAPQATEISAEDVACMWYDIYFHAI
jgi:hypothetical protein